MNRRQGFCDVLQETGVRILWDVAGSFGLEEQRSLEELPGADLVAALDDVSLTSAGQCAAANDLHGAVVYGIGTSTEAVYYLDTGTWNAWWCRMNLMWGIRAWRRWLQAFSIISGK